MARTLEEMTQTMNMQDDGDDGDDPAKREKQKRKYAKKRASITNKKMLQLQAKQQSAQSDNLVVRVDDSKAGIRLKNQRLGVFAVEFLVPGRSVGYWAGDRCSPDSQEFVTHYEQMLSLPHLPKIAAKACNPLPTPMGVGQYVQSVSRVFADVDFPEQATLIERVKFVFDKIREYALTCDRGNVDWAHRYLDMNPEQTKHYVGDDKEEEKKHYGEHVRVWMICVRPIYGNEELIFCPDPIWWMRYLIQEAKKKQNGSVAFMQTLLVAHHLFQDELVMKTKLVDNLTAGQSFKAIHDIEPKRVNLMVSYLTVVWQWIDACQPERMEQRINNYRVPTPKEIGEYAKQNDIKLCAMKHDLGSIRYTADMLRAKLLNWREFVQQRLETDMHKIWGEHWMKNMRETYTDELD